MHANHTPPPQQSSRRASAHTTHRPSAGTNVPSVIFAPMTLQNAEIWLTSATTLMLLLASLFVESHLLGSTAIWGSVHLWGIPDPHNLSPNMGYRFFNALECLQLGSFVLALAACAFSLFKSKHTGLVALTFFMTVALTAAQSFEYNGEEWFDMRTSKGQIYLIWASALLLHAFIRVLILLRSKATNTHCSHGPNKV